MPKRNNIQGTAPKTSTKLRAGDFWDIPLPDGSYACARITVPQPHGPKVRSVIVACLLDWHGDDPPTSDSIAGVLPVTDQALMGVEAIAQSGGVIRGNRDLELDGIKPIDAQDERVGAKMTVWGWRVIITAAHNRFCPSE